MDILEIIDKKRNKKKLTQQEINYFINGYIDKSIKDYQVSALLMAIVINGMDDNETFYLNDAMLNSGKKINLKSVAGIKIDKHSTGGIGDKVSLILAPICVALGIKVAKMSGRGLGFTGGTIDKLESIGVNCSISVDKALKQLKANGMFIIAQTEDIVVADKLLYSLRSATSTAQSLPLIATSVASKKLALGTDYIFLDVKFGSGAFCETIADATQLANMMIKIFKRYHRIGVVHITNMDQPLGRAIGNAIEIKASIDFLKGNPENDAIKTLIYEFVADILITVKRAKTKAQAHKMIDAVIQNKKALQTFYKWTASQGANIDELEKEKYFKPKYKEYVKASKSGYVNYLSSKKIGLIALELGAGRFTKESAIDFQASIWLDKVQNEFVSKGSTIATFYSSKPISEHLIKEFYSNVTITSKKVKALPLIAKVVK